MKEILVLGPGCFRCTKLHENVEKAVSELGIECDVYKVTDINAIAEFGVMQTPGLIIDGEVKALGKVLSVDQIRELLMD